MKKLLGTVFFLIVAINSFAAPALSDLKCYGIAGVRTGGMAYFLIKFENKTGKDIELFTGQYTALDSSGYADLKIRFNTGVSENPDISAGETFYMLIREDLVEDSYFDSNYVGVWVCKGYICSDADFKKGVTNGMWVEIPTGALKGRCQITGIRFSDGTYITQ